MILKTAYFCLLCQSHQIITQIKRKFGTSTDSIKKDQLLLVFFLLDIISCNGVALRHKRWHAIA